ncbi:sodium:solute symporter family transporter [Paenibacillus anseongense]|uniref:sodium:solute symporter family transporter n=1 Tax=Paenibacillus TaxID=44249 RepID=UPI002DB92E76|nr:transporter [Paenibacillus anseongense]MEC0269549.1 transporter [Paenibacillus anseongense]
MQYQSFREYAQGAAKIGIGLGVIAILARWVTGITIFASPEALVKYGIFGGIGYALMGAIALMAFGWLGKKVRREYGDGLTIGDFFQNKLHGLGYWMMIVILLITSIEGLFTQGMAAGVLVNILLGVPISIGMLCFFLLCVIYVGFGGMALIQRLAFVQVILMFAAAILIPLYFFIAKGVENVYQGIRLYHPYLLVLNNHEGLFFMCTGLLIGFGQIFVDQATWQRLYMIESKKIVPTFLLSGLIWATVPLAFSSLIMVVIFTGSFNNIYSLLFDLIRKIDTIFLLVLFVLCSFGAVTSAFGAGLHSMISLIAGNVYPLLKPDANEKQKMRMGYMLAITIGVLSFVLTYFFTPTLLDLLFFFGIIYAALIVPLLFIVFSKGKVDNFIPLCALIGLVAGYSSRYTLGNLEAVWVSMMVSSLLVIVYWCGKFMKKHLGNH